MQSFSYPNPKPKGPKLTAFCKRLEKWLSNLLYSTLTRTITMQFTAPTREEWDDCGKKPFFGRSCRLTNVQRAGLLKGQQLVRNGTHRPPKLTYTQRLQRQKQKHAEGQLNKLQAAMKRTKAHPPKAPKSSGPKAEVLRAARTFTKPKIAIKKRGSGGNMQMSHKLKIPKLF